MYRFYDLLSSLYRTEEYSRQVEPPSQSYSQNKVHAKKHEDTRLPSLTAADRYPDEYSSFSTDVESKIEGGGMSDDRTNDDSADWGDDYEDMPADVCQFCQLQDPRLAEGENMDLHFYHECPMLVACHECSQIIEIASITEHLLTECDNMQVSELSSFSQLSSPHSTTRLFFSSLPPPPPPPSPLSFFRWRRSRAIKNAHGVQKLSM